MAFQSLLTILLVLLIPSLAIGASYQVGPPPKWVVPLTPDSSLRPPESVTRGEWFLLRDMQVRIEAQGKTDFYHFANKAVDSRGVSRIANISIEFDPTYEALTIHAINVLRAGRMIDKLKSAKIDVLQREKDLEYQIFDGSKTVNVVLEDLRVGDTVEYSYSRSGLNPVFDNRVTGGTDLQWSVPLARSLVRLLVPKNRKLTVEERKTSFKPSVIESNGYREYRWEQRDLSALKVDDDTPARYNPYPYVVWTEFQDWASVVDWALRWYRIPEQSGPALIAAIAEIRKATTSPEERLLAVLKMVQRDIRYLGVEVGPGSHAPNTPDIVFKRRFGDCKDKALLMVTMLRALDVTAAPALVNTEHKARVLESLPSPNAFNHAIVRVRIAGNDYWVDPTRSEQSGDLAHLSQADFGHALVLERGNKTLVGMAPAVPGKEGKRVHAVFDATDGDSKPVRYTVKTIFQSGAAEKMRSELASSGKTQLQSDYLNYYARRYPSIRAAAPLSVVDDSKNNSITTTESYLISDFWQKNKESKSQAYVRSSEIRNLLKQPETPIRTSPLEIKFPAEIDEVTEVWLNGDWDVTPSNIKVNDAAFEFQHKTEGGKGKVKYRLTDHYRALSDSVEPSAVRAYAENLQKAYDSVGITLTKHDNGRGEGNGAFRAWSRAINWNLAFYVGLGLIWGVLKLFVRRSIPEHRSHNMALTNQFVGTVFCIFLAVRFMPNNWKLYSSVIVIAYFGTVFMTTLADNAPELHWLYAGKDREAYARYPSIQRNLIRAFFALPSVFFVGAGLYYLGMLITQ